MPTNGAAPANGAGSPSRNGAAPVESEPPAR
jgi:hypothetical protein